MKTIEFTAWFEQRFFQNIHAKKLISKTHHILLAVSGGVDSMVMLRLFRRFAPELKLQLAIAHVNHGLRGKSAQDDAAFVKAMARLYGMPFYGTRVHARQHARRNKLSVEEACRVLRYDFLENTASTYGFDHVATAHHADDQAETVLMRIIKGTGIQGLSGIPEVRGKYIRPLLPFTRDEIHRYARENRIPFVTDLTNEDTAFLRNRIRHQILPDLRTINPQISHHLSRLADIAKSAADVLQMDAKRCYTKVFRTQKGKIWLEIQAFNRYYPIRQYTLLQMFFASHAPWFTLTSVEYERILDLIQHQQPGRKFDAGKWRWTKTTRAVVITPVDTSSRTKDVTLTIGNTVSWGSWKIRSSVARYTDTIRKNLAKNPFIVYLDAGSVTKPIRVRAWKNGDRFKPYGMHQFKNVSDFFVDHKIPVTEKHTIPVLTHGRDIVWIGGMRTDDRYKVTPDTLTVIKLELITHES